MSAVIRFFVAVFDTGSDVFNGLNFLKVHLSFGQFIDNLLDSVGGSSSEKIVENTKSDPIWRVMAISLIFLPGLMYSFLKLWEEDEKVPKTFIDLLKEHHASQEKDKDNVEHGLGKSVDKSNITEDAKNIVEASKMMRVFNFLFYLFLFPLALISNCFR